MIDLKQLEVWFVTGSQHLYGPETLEHGRRALAPRSPPLWTGAGIPVGSSSSRC